MPKSRGGRHRAFDGRLGGEIASHRVKRDSHAPLRNRLPQRPRPAAFRGKVPQVMAYVMGQAWGSPHCEQAAGLTAPQRVMGTALCCAWNGKYDASVLAIDGYSFPLGMAVFRKRSTLKARSHRQAWIACLLLATATREG